MDFQVENKEPAREVVERKVEEVMDGKVIKKAT